MSFKRPYYYINDLANYEYCPSKYFLEKLAKNKMENKELFSKFEINKELFAIYIRNTKSKKYVNSNMLHALNRNKALLFKNNKNFNKNLLIAYTMKIFDKFFYELGTGLEIESKDTLLFDFYKHTIAIKPDVIVSTYNNARNKKGRNYKQITTSVCFLVDSKYWSKYDLYNRLENYVFFKYIIPVIKNDKEINTDLYNIVYLCPENGNSFTISHLLLETANLALSKQRLLNTIQQLKTNTFIKTPLEVKCSLCNVSELCNETSKGSITTNKKLKALQFHQILAPLSI